MSRLPHREVTDSDLGGGETAGAGQLPARRDEADTP
jgi:hypothetical protein